MPLRCLKRVELFGCCVSAGWCGFRHWQIILAATGWSTKNIPQLWVREQGSLIQPHPSTGAFWFEDLSHVTHIDRYTHKTPLQSLNTKRCLGCAKNISQTNGAMRCHPSLNTITDRQADKRIEDWIPGLNTSYSCSSEVLTYCAVLLTVDNNPPWQVGVAFHTVKESKAPDQTRFHAPMDPQEESVMSWNNIILPLLRWVIRFGLAHTRENRFLVWERSVENIQGGTYCGKAVIITSTFLSDSAQDILTGACGVWNPYSVDVMVWMRMIIKLSWKSWK